MDYFNPRTTPVIFDRKKSTNSKKNQYLFFKKVLHFRFPYDKIVYDMGKDTRIKIFREQTDGPNRLFLLQ